MTFFVFGAVTLILLGSASLAFSSTDARHQQQTEYCASNPCDSTPNTFCDSSSKSCKCRDGMYQDPWPEDKTRTCIQWLGSTCRKVDLKTVGNITLPCTANATCDKSNLCKCSEGFYQKYRACEPLVAMGGSCVSNIECGTDEFTGSQLVCFNGICSCDPHRSVYAAVKGNVENAKDGEETAMCAPFAMQKCYKGFCAPRAECSLTFNSQRNYYWNESKQSQSQSAVCQCERPYEFNDRTRDCLAPYNGICDFEISCIDGFICNSQTGRCECSATKFYDNTLKKCITNLGSLCSLTSECPANAHCRNKCYCESNYVQVGLGRSASCVPDYGASCNIDSDCNQRRNSLICTGKVGNKRCTCQRGLKMFPKTKTCALPYGARCISTTDCGDDMKCTRDRCNCTDLMHFDKVRRICVSSIGKACSFQDDCGAKAFCSFGACRCVEGYVPIPASGCAAGFGTSCSSSSDCAQTTNELICDEGKCACKEELKMSPTTGHCSLEHGAPCSNNSIPCFDKLECNGMCSCPGSQFVLDNRCLNYAGDSCSEAADCIPNGECHNQNCTCSKGYVRSAEGLCDPDFGSPCSSSGDCAKNENNLICENGTCACPSGLKMSNKSCSIQFKDYCEGSVPIIDGLICKENECECPLMSQVVNTETSRCVQRAGGSCQESSDCIAGAFCDRSYHSSSGTVSHCNCLNGTVENSYRRCINNREANCTEDADCDTAAGLECIDFQCRCSTNAFYSPDSRKCFGFVGTECIPESVTFMPMEWMLLEVVESCTPNAVCAKRTVSSPSNECLCLGPKFMEAKNNTCVLSPNYQE